MCVWLLCACPRFLLFPKGGSCRTLVVCTCVSCVCWGGAFLTASPASGRMLGLLSLSPRLLIGGFIPPGGLDEFRKASPHCRLITPPPHFSNSPRLCCVFLPPERLLLKMPTLGLAVPPVQKPPAHDGHLLCTSVWTIWLALSSGLYLGHI